jgi:hypothetical protein
MGNFLCKAKYTRSASDLRLQYSFVKLPQTRQILMHGGGTVVGERSITMQGKTQAYVRTSALAEP